MGTTAQKLTYLNTTKLQLKDMINYGLDSESKITNETTFREYVNSTFEAFMESLRNPDTLFNNLPKVTGEGTSVTLNNTANAPMKMIPMASEISQDGEPTPDYPQQIHTISGDNEIKVKAKNLINIENILRGGVTSTGIANDFGISSMTITNNIIEVITTQTYRGCYTDYIEVDTNKSYSVSFDKLNSNSYFAFLNFYDKDKIFISRTSTRNNVTPPANTKYVIVFVGIETIGTLKISNLQLEIGTTSSQYQQYQNPQIPPLNLGNLEYCKIGEYEDEFVIASGKNKLNINRTLGVPSNTAFSNTTKRTFNYNEFVKGIASSNYYNGNAGSDVSINGNTLSFTSTVANYGLGFPVKVNKNTTYTLSRNASSNSITFIMYYEEDGSFINYTDAPSFTTPANCDFIVIAFIPTTANTTVTFSNIQLEEGTIVTPFEPYGNGKWYLKKNIGKILSYNGETITTTYMSTTGGLNTGATIYYGLTTSTYTLLNDTLQTQLNNIQKVLAYQDQTNISQVNNDLPFTIKASAIEDLI